MKILDTLKLLKTGIDFVGAHEVPSEDDTVSTGLTDQDRAYMYPDGLKVMEVSGSNGWPGHGNVLTMKFEDKATQIWISKSGSNLWIRGTDSQTDGLFTSWRQVEGTGWTNVTAWSNGWQGYSGTGSTFDPPGYRKDAQGVVRLRGMISGGSLTTAAFTLPAGYRPPHRLILTGLTNGPSFGQLRVHTGGSVVPHDGLTFFSLNGISFHAVD